MEAALLALVIGGEHVAARGSPAAGTYVTLATPQSEGALAGSCSHMARGPRTRRRRPSPVGARDE